MSDDLDKFIDDHACRDPDCGCNDEEADTTCPGCGAPAEACCTSTHRELEQLRREYAAGAELSRATIATLRAGLDELYALVEDASLDHSCSLEGWDEECAECRLARHLYQRRRPQVQHHSQQ